MPEYLEQHGHPCTLPEPESEEERQERLEQQKRAEEVREDWRDDEKLWR